MGRAARERIVDLELNKTDFAEIPAEDARRAAERGVRVSRSQPDELLALVFSGGAEAGRSEAGRGEAGRGEAGRGEAVDARAREAIALSIDRAAIVNFILQKEGEPAGGLIAAMVERDGVSVFDGSGRGACEGTLGANRSRRENRVGI